MDNHLLNVYNRLPLQIERGEGSWLFDTAGNKYLDAYCGIAVTGLGHNHPAVTNAIQSQAAKIIHLSNLVEIPQQSALADALIVTAGFEGKVFFNNCGAEAVETMLKLSRLYGHSKNIANPKVMVFTGAFHGRTIATISAGDSAKAQAGFEPLLPGLVRVKYNDSAAIASELAADPDIVAILVEPIQGESGVRFPAADYLNQVRKLCDQHNVLMLLDEVQSGMARTGKFFCYQHNNIVPDAISMAKGLANGIPIGACIIRAPYCDLFKVGSHGSTFGGNPLSCAVAIATLQEIHTKKLYDNAAKQGKKLLDGLRAAFTGNKHVVEIRGMGLIMGIQLDRDCLDILPVALKNHIIFNIANYNTLRILPPINISDAETQLLLDKLILVINEYFQNLNK